MKAYLFPGQGSQFVNMGANEFDRYPEILHQADELLGYSLRELCQKNPGDRLNNTAYTQPALFVVNHLMYLDRLAADGTLPAFLAGHSLGEYNAIVAAGALSFEDALRLVKRRGELMAGVTDGGMLAVLRIPQEMIQAKLIDFGLTGIDIANQNAPAQTILSGRKIDLAVAAERFASIKDCMCIPLNVSGPFHSRYMAEARDRFDVELARVSFDPMNCLVISNYTARPYDDGRAVELLSSQIVKPVRWVDTMRYLMAHGVDEFIQVGPGNVINGLTKRILATCEPMSAAELTPGDQLPSQPEPVRKTLSVSRQEPTETSASADPGIVQQAEELGSQDFRTAFGLSHAYVAGGMYKGISSVEVVVAMARAGMLGVYGAGGVDLDEVRDAITAIRSQLGENGNFAVNYISDSDGPEREAQFVDMLLAQQVRLVEASAFMSASAQLVRYRAAGLSRGRDGLIERRNRIIAKLSHPEVAKVFAQAPQQRVVDQLVMDGSITAEQGELVTQVPLADAITVEGNSGGHTDGGILEVLLPTIRRQVRDLERASFGTASIFVGAAGGIGAPEAAAVAFLLGADYIVTGSINQCTVEAGTSEHVKDLLTTVDIQDTRLAATGDMFELGSKIQVVRKGLFFPARANRLYELYRQYGSLSAIPMAERTQLESKYFKRSLDSVYAEVEKHISADQKKRCEESPQAKMVAIFKWYFMMSTYAALTGDAAWRLDYQIQCGPSMGAFNRWVRGTELEDWRHRHVDAIALRLLTAAGQYLNKARFGNGSTLLDPPDRSGSRSERSTMKEATA